ncbi:MAG: aldose 1-epimerase family protein [Chitinophagaceae bacterium]|jgi:galactose mutarotase-like enzyme|nr:aldose 1-epimerase family protein [Chitinophagaceae bacterium]
MAIHTISNGILDIQVKTKGAELAGLYNRQTGLEYMWNGDPAFWAKQSPVLFPIVGTLRQNIYYVNGQAYQLGRHGFARDTEFVLREADSQSLVFSLESDAATLEKYPFPFRFDIIYTLDETSLQVAYHVHNTGHSPLYFSVGGHPAFKVPLVEGTVFEDYELYFEEEENSGRWLISPDGLIEKKSSPLLQHTHVLALTKPLFSRDALVFKDIRSSVITLRSSKTPHGLRFTKNGFPYLGIWSAPGADLVCIEPWCGIADPVDSTQQLQEKEGIEVLAPDQVFERSWSVTTF